MFCLCGAEAEASVRVSLPGACSALARGSEPLRPKRVPCKPGASLPSSL